MQDLFDTPIISGLRTASDFLRIEEEREFIACMDHEPLTPFQFQQWAGKRQTHSFGWNYDFKAGINTPADPMPEWLAGVRDRAAAFAGLEPGKLVQALLIRYDPGAGIGWHRDRPTYDHVIGISLGNAADMRFRRREGEKWERRSMPLDPRGIYHLAGEARYRWEHSIVNMKRPRWSITLRSFAQ